jgi:phage gp36-like protein
MALATITLYASRTDLEHLLSVYGVDQRLDHDGSGGISAAEEAFLTDCLTEASETVNWYLFNRYDPVNLAMSNWVARKTTILAAYRLTSSRGNPPLFVEDAERALDDLERAVTDPRFGPPGVPIRPTCIPVFSNLRVDARYNWRCIRVEKNNSSPIPTKLRQNVDIIEANTIEI